MAIRMIDTNRRNEDWYWSLGGEYQCLWDYICETCDNAGVWKPNIKDFETKTNFKVSLDQFFRKVNESKTDGGFERIVKLPNGRWFLPGFIKFQWFNKQGSFVLNLSSGNQQGIYNSLISNGVDLKTVRGLVEVKERSRRPHSNSNSNSNSNCIKEENDSVSIEDSNYRKWGETLKAERLFTESTCIAWGLNEEALKKMIDSFLLENESKGKSWKDYADFKSHFFSWGKFKGRFLSFQTQKKSVNDYV